MPRDGWQMNAKPASQYRCLAAASGISPKVNQRNGCGIRSLLGAPHQSRRVTGKAFAPLSHPSHGHPELFISQAPAAFPSPNPGHGGSPLGSGAQPITDGCC